MFLAHWLNWKSIDTILQRRVTPLRDILLPRFPSKSIPFSLPSQTQSKLLTCDGARTLHSQENNVGLHEDINRENSSKDASPTFQSDQALQESSNSAVDDLPDIQPSKDIWSNPGERLVNLRKITASISQNDPTKVGLSKSQYARWRAAVERSRVHKDNKAKRQDELSNTMVVDWHHGFNLLKKRTKNPKHAQSTARLVWSGSKRTPITQARADQITQPSEWSVFTFRNHVEDLVSSSVSPLQHRQLYKGGESHVSVVAEILRRLFGNVALECYWSVEACNLALVFFYKHSMLDMVRALYAQMEDRKYLTSTETFNIMLMGSASRKNLAQFQGLLDAMIKRGLEPNSQTWEAFFVVNTSSQIRYHVYQSIRDRGVLGNLHAMKNFLTLNIRETFCKQLDKGRSATWFLEYMDKLNEISWLSPSIGNVLLHEIGKRGSAEDAVHLLGELESRGMTLDNMTLRTLLHLCLPNRNHELLIHILDRFHHQHKIYPDRVAYESIFRQFWRSRLLNCSKVVWRYACVEGQASSAIRRLVGQNLAHEPKNLANRLGNARNVIWKSSAGRLSLGVELGMPWVPTLHLSLMRQGNNTSGDTERLQSAAKALLEQDLASAHRHSIKRSLPDLLSEALAMDRQWANEYAWQHKSPDWFLENAINVDLNYAIPWRFRPLGKGLLKPSVSLQ